MKNLQITEQKMKTNKSLLNLKMTENRVTIFLNLGYLIQHLLNRVVFK